ncbi:Plant regulator RWP-RK [Cynara cardunculus var. scolymus]|uniref:Plant regulator RWP-RK n=1 Tax=Cynara cardunculus var. scolymus TaxID=59895 RepID=A0A118JXP8_CYNCS|nr:Plant regulator RWP-RK [Cynara cardunculus var. scolymus]
MNQSDVEIDRARPSYKTTFSTQRERTGKLTIKDLVGFFHIPIEVAAKKIQVCPTVIKKICLDAEVRGRAQSEIDTFRQEIANIYARFNG